MDPGDVWLKSPFSLSRRQSFVYPYFGQPFVFRTTECTPAKLFRDHVRYLVQPRSCDALACGFEFLRDDGANPFRNLDDRTGRTDPDLTVGQVPGGSCSNFFADSALFHSDQNNLLEYIPRERPISGAGLVLVVVTRFFLATKHHLFRLSLTIHCS